MSALKLGQKKKKEKFGDGEHILKLCFTFLFSPVWFFFLNDKLNTTNVITKSPLFSTGTKLSMLHTMAHLTLLTLWYMDCCCQLQKQAKIQGLLWGHTTRMWSCDRKSHLTLNSRLFSMTSFYKGVSSTALRFPVYTALLILRTLIFGVMTWICSTTFCTITLTLWSICFVPTLCSV